MAPMGRTATEGKTYSVELCGGTHVNATGDIQLFRIISESAVSSGVRRIEALTGDAARQWLVDREERLKDAASALRTTPEEVTARVQALLDERKQLEKDLAAAKKQLALGGGGPAEAESAIEKLGDVSFSGQVIDGLDPKELRPLLDEAKQRLGSGVAAICATNEGKAAFAVAVTDDLTTRFSAVDLVRAGVAELGGNGGGGRPDMAQGGGPDASRAEAALDAVRNALREAVSA